MKILKQFCILALIWSWLIPGSQALFSLFILVDEGIPDMLLGTEKRQFDFDFVAPVVTSLSITALCFILSSCVGTYFAYKRQRNDAQPDLTAQ